LVREEACELALSAYPHVLVLMLQYMGSPSGAQHDPGLRELLAAASASGTGHLLPGGGRRPTQTGQVSFMERDRGSCVGVSVYCNFSSVVWWVM